MKLFVVTAYRWGDPERHSYVVGVTDSLALARVFSALENDERGGKYICEIVSMEINDRLNHEIDGTGIKSNHTVEVRVTPHPYFHEPCTPSPSA